MGRLSETCDHIDAIPEGGAKFYWKLPTVSDLVRERRLARELELARVLVNRQYLHVEGVAHADELLDVPDPVRGQLGNVAEPFQARKGLAKDTKAPKVLMETTSEA